MAFNRTRLNAVTDITESIYTISITAKENKLRANMKILREMFQSKKVDPATCSQECLANCLWFAVYDQDTASVQEIMKYNPDVNVTRSDINMVWMSIIRNNMEIAQMLVEGGADVTVRISEGGPSFLHFLVTTVDDEASLELAKLMIQKGADVNACVLGKYSVLQTALKHEAVPFVKELLDNGACSKSIDLILIAARSSKSDELVALLVNSIRDVDERCAAIYEAMQYLIEKKKNVAVLKEMKALLKLDLPVLEMDIDGWTIMRIAVSCERTDVVQLLLDYDAEVYQKTGKRSSSLLWSEHNKNLNESHKMIVKYLANLVFNGDAVYESDLANILDCQKMSDYYDMCFSDLLKKE